MRRRGAMVLATLLLAAAPLAACGDSGPRRSTESFCSTMRSEKQRILAQLEEATSAADAAGARGDGFTAALFALGGSVQALGELRTYMRKLEAVAPDAIRVEMGLLSEFADDAFDSASAAADNPVAALAGALVGGVAISGPLSTVDSFARSNCGEGI